MREIKFRGKRIDAEEWVYGDLIHGVGSKSGRMYILPVTLTYPKGCNELDGWDVIPTTVGQFTGLTDKDGRGIYEGDIVSDKATTFEIIWRKGNFDFKRVDGCYQFPYFGDNCSRMEIIGNIHDNPELLEQTK